MAAYAAWFHSWWGSYTLSRAEGFYLWGRVSSFAECSVIKPPASEQAICPSGTPSSRTPPGDYIWHAPEVHHMANGGPVTAANDALLRDFAIRAVKAQPLGYLHAVLGGLALSVEWPRHPYPDVGTVYFYYFHLTPYTIPAHHSWVAGGTAYSDAVQYGHAIPSRVVRPVANLIDGYQRVFYTYGPLFGLILLTGLGGVLRLAAPPDGACRVCPGRPAPGACCPGPPRSCCWCSRSRSPTSTTGTCSPSCRSPAWPRAWPSPRPGSRPRRNRSPSRGTTSPARCPDRSAEASLCQFVSV